MRTYHTEWWAQSGNRKLRTTTRPFCEGLHVALGQADPLSAGRCPNCRHDVHPYGPFKIHVGGKLKTHVSDLDKLEASLEYLEELMKD